MGKFSLVRTLLAVALLAAATPASAATPPPDDSKEVRWICVWAGRLPEGTMELLTGRLAMMDLPARLVYVDPVTVCIPLGHQHALIPDDALRTWFPDGVPNPIADSQTVALSVCVEDPSPNGPARSAVVAKFALAAPGRAPLDPTTASNIADSCQSGVAIGALPVHTMTDPMGNPLPGMKTSGGADKTRCVLHRGSDPLGASTTTWVLGIVLASTLVFAFPAAVLAVVAVTAPPGSALAASTGVAAAVLGLVAVAVDVGAAAYGYAASLNADHASGGGPTPGPGSNPGGGTPGPGSNPGGGTPGPGSNPGGGGATPRPRGGLPGGEQESAFELCMKTREFLAQCERANWATAECAAFKARVDGCPDPTLILTSPDQPDCGSRRSPVEMEAAIAEQLVACNSLIRPTGPDVDPCRDAILARFQDPETPLAFEECDPTITDPCPDPGIVIVESNVWCAPEVPGNLGGMPEFCVQTGPEPFPGPGPEHWISIPVVGGV